jgi:hypothetical protein
MKHTHKAALAAGLVSLMAGPANANNLFLASTKFTSPAPAPSQDTITYSGTVQRILNDKGFLLNGNNGVIRVITSRDAGAVLNEGDNVDVISNYGPDTGAVDALRVQINERAGV